MGGTSRRLLRAAPLRIVVSVLGLEGRLPLSPPAAGDGVREHDE